MGTYLRARREQARPEAAGVPDQRNRRVPGLRREEVAFLAGVSLGELMELHKGLTELNEAARRAGVQPLPAPASGSI